MRKKDPERSVNVVDILFILLFILKEQGKISEEAIKASFDKMLADTKIKDKVYLDNSRTMLQNYLNTIKKNEVLKYQLGFGPQPSYYAKFYKTKQIYSITKDGLGFLTNPVLFSNKGKLEEWYFRAMGAEKNNDINKQNGNSDCFEQNETASSGSDGFER